MEEEIIVSDTPQDEVSDEVLESSAEKEDDNNVEQKQISEEQVNKTETEIELPQTQEQAQEVLQTKGFDYVALQKEYLETGNISETTRKQLSEVGITSELVDNFIEGQIAKAEQERNELAACVGGRENFDNIIKWASENLSEAEIKSINGITDKSVITIILKDLKNRMEEKEGITPNYTNGEAGKIVKDIFRSQAEMFEAISNPKYRVDEAYRADVQRKVTASREAGVDLGI